MKVAYIAHPINGDIEGNLEKVRLIGRKINLEEAGVVPFAPYYFACKCLNDNIPDERARGIKNNIALLESGIVDEVRLYGPCISRGMRKEIELAHFHEIKVVPMTPETGKEYQSYIDLL